LIWAAIVFCSPPSPVCDYPPFTAHAFRLAVGEEGGDEEDGESDSESPSY
jgi:hypothetical protein